MSDERRVSFAMFVDNDANGCRRLPCDRPRFWAVERLTDQPPWCASFYIGRSATPIVTRNKASFEFVLDFMLLLTYDTYPDPIYEGYYAQREPLPTVAPEEVGIFFYHSSLVPETLQDFRASVRDAVMVMVGGF
jgi:hypothetical protein